MAMLFGLTLGVLVILVQALLWRGPGCREFGCGLLLAPSGLTRGKALSCSEAPIVDAGAGRADDAIGFVVRGLFVAAPPLSGGRLNQAVHKFRGCWLAPAAVRPVTFLGAIDRGLVQPSQKM